MHAEGTAMDRKEKRRRAKCTSAETKQSKQKLTRSQIIKSNKNKRENVTVCSCSTWGGSNCLCSVAFCILNVSYSFGVSSSKGFPPAQTTSKVPQVTTDWHRRLEEGLVSEHTHFSPIILTVHTYILKNVNRITSGQNSGSPTSFILVRWKSFWHSWEHKSIVGQEWGEGTESLDTYTWLQLQCFWSEVTKPLLRIWLACVIGSSLCIGISNQISFKVLCV